MSDAFVDRTHAVRAAQRARAGADVAVSVGAAAVSALLLWASSPAVGAGWLAWVALVPALAAALRHPAARSARLALPLTCALYLELLLVPALPFGLAQDQWADDPVLPVMLGDSPVVFVAGIAIPLFGAALYAVRFPFVGSERERGIVPALVAGATWTALDFLRVELDPGGLFGPLFLSQHDAPASALAAIGGPWLLTFAIVAANVAVALLAVRGRGAVRAAAGLVAGLAVLVAVSLAVHARWTGARTTAVVAAVQPGYDTSEFERPALRHFRRETRDYERAALDVIHDLEPLTRAAARSGAELVVWPEATVWVDPRETDTVRAALGTLARESGVTVVVPYFIRDAAESAAVAVLPDGRITEPRPKQRPMWYLGERAGGGSAQPFSAPPAAVATLLGVDNQHPGAARALVARGARVLAVSTHDWRQLAIQQRAFARLHAVALARPVVRADWRYGSAVYEPHGVAADAGVGKRRAVVRAAVGVPSVETPYARSGDAAAWVAVAAGALLAIGAALRRRATEG